MTEENEENYRNIDICRFCEKEIIDNKVRDHFHLTGYYRGPAHSKCNVNVTQKQSNLYNLNFITLVITIVTCASKN